ncbi:STAS domain-containing protein [Pseudothauera rhizosphaerae]|uniref:STAS domain-containing protein n=1 Tax=Pseudothauera rhizosphaerae TaxID=2565932 RepID=A0A4S4APT0_9RHOO|nr:STAS domain-containing protein [Pseudothauera rhizosphaerae]THF61716.1 STAS domain-containing protein [Pseudothauera rhizosphaerae]
MIASEGEVLRLEGPLTMATVAPLLEEGCRAAAAADRVVDLSAVTVADSAALALLFAWLRSARANGRRLVLRGVPAGLQSLAVLYGVDGLLPLDA